jgi:hypothetical protein
MQRSALRDIVADDEGPVKVLTSSSQFNAQMAKPAAF